MGLVSGFERRLIGAIFVVRGGSWTTPGEFVVTVKPELCFSVASLGFLKLAALSRSIAVRQPPGAADLSIKCSLIVNQSLYFIG